MSYSLEIEGLVSHKQKLEDEIERLKEASEHSYQRGYVNGARKTREELGAEIERLKAAANAAFYAMCAYRDQNGDLLAWESHLKSEIERLDKVIGQQQVEIEQLRADFNPRVKSPGAG